MTVFLPKLDSLPPTQCEFWPELAAVPGHFVLYGGTALALRLGHRQSVDFDFFSSEPFSPDELVRQVAFLPQGERLQSAVNTLTVSLPRGWPIKVSFFGGLKLGRVGNPDRTEDNRIWVASLQDLAATKMAVVQQRAEKRDYFDIEAILRSGVSLPQCLGAAVAVYGEQFNPAITLKALTYFRDGDLPSLSQDVQARLSRGAAQVALIPSVRRVADRLAPES